MRMRSNPAKKYNLSVKQLETRGCLTQEAAFFADAYARCRRGRMLHSRQYVALALVCKRRFPLLPLDCLHAIRFHLPSDLFVLFHGGR